jgi:hypothetical protein
MATGTQTEAGGARPAPVDEEPTSRPGVPMMGARLEGRAKAPALDQQEPTQEVLVGVEVGRLTPVFGATIAPRGLSGMLRRRAYRIPEHHAGRWMLLLLGDRVDVWESRVLRHPILALAALGGLVLAGAKLRAARR